MRDWKNIVLKQITTLNLSSLSLVQRLALTILGVSIISIIIELASNTYYNSKLDDDKNFVFAHIYEVTYKGNHRIKYIVDGKEYFASFNPGWEYGKRAGN